MLFCLSNLSETIRLELLFLSIHEGSHERSLIFLYAQEIVEL